MTTIYLAGAMTGLTLEEMQGWRREAARVLGGAGFKVMDPTYNGLDMTLTPEEIVTINKFMISKSDIILAEFNQEKPSIGTIGEVVWARQAFPLMPIFVWGKNQKLISYPWIFVHLTARFLELKNALESIVENYSFPKRVDDGQLSFPFEVEMRKHPVLMRRYRAWCKVIRWQCTSTDIFWPMCCGRRLVKVML